jgi:hypothetical protein
MAKRLIMRKTARKTAGDARVNFLCGKPTVVDGPFDEDGGPRMAGFSMLDANSREDAVEWVKRPDDRDNFRARAADALQRKSGGDGRAFHRGK